MNEAVDGLLCISLLASFLLDLITFSAQTILLSILGYLEQ